MPVNLNRYLCALCLTLLASRSVAGAESSPPASHDLVIRNGRVLDGAGNPWVRADVAVKGGRIVELGTVTGRGAREIDATGRYVSPGFIDMMDQSGQALLENGAAANKLHMGVTTVISGEGGTPVEAARIGEYFQRLEQQGIAVNFGTYYQATQARRVVIPEGAGSPTREQLEIMKTEVARAMQAGVFGISTALIYPPSTFQSTAELIELAKVAGKCHGFYATHLRDEGPKLIDAIQEAIEIGEQGGVKVEIFHLKAAYAPGWGTFMAKAVATIEAARARGVDVAADLYPYTAGRTGLSITVPTWVFADGQAKGLERLKEPRVRERLKRELAAGSQPGWSNLVEAGGGWDRVVLANAYSSKYSRYESKSLAEIALQLGRDPADIAWDIVLDAAPRRPMALFFLADERDIEVALEQSWTSIGSDAGVAEAVGNGDVPGKPHPRAYGTFPRIISEYVKKRAVLTLEQAVRKMTSWPALRMGIGDRGLIREGMRADLVVFDLERLVDRATWERPTDPPAGIDHVVVNGRVALDAGVPTGTRAGQVLRHRCDSL